MRYTLQIAILTVINIFFSAAAFSQRQSCSFHSYNSVQLFNGQAATSVGIQSVNGWQYQKLFAGLGAGFDYYYHRSVPVFAELRYNLAGQSRQWQLYMNGGINLPFGKQNKKEPYKTGDFKSGRVLAAGIDYHIPVKKDAFIAGIGFSQKTITQMVDNTIWNPALSRMENVPIRERFEFNRIIVKVGWVF